MVHKPLSFFVISVVVVPSPNISYADPNCGLNFR
jgi:hypothetical protein